MLLKQFDIAGTVGKGQLNRVGMIGDKGQVVKILQ